MKKTIYISAVTVLLAVFLAAVFAPVYSVETAAAGGSACGVHFEKTSEEDTVTLTAVLTEYGKNVNGVVLALDFDPAKVSITEDDIAVLSGGTLFSSRIDHENGKVSAECAYFNGLSDDTPLASFRFRLIGDISAGSIDQSVIRLCEDNEYLSGLSPNYAWCGGVYLTNGMESFTANEGLDIQFDIPEAPGSDETEHDIAEKTGGCSGTGGVAAVIGGFALIIAAVMILIRKKKK